MINGNKEYFFVIGIVSTVLFLLFKYYIHYESGNKARMNFLE